MVRGLVVRTPALPVRTAEPPEVRPLTSTPAGDLLPGQAAQAAAAALRCRREDPAPPAGNVVSRAAQELAARVGEAAPPEAESAPEEEREAEDRVEGVEEEVEAIGDAPAVVAPALPALTLGPPRVPTDDGPKRAEAALDEEIDAVEALELEEDPTVGEPVEEEVEGPEVAAPDPSEPEDVAGLAAGDGGATTSIAAWQGRVEGAADAVPAPDMPAPATYTAPIQTGGGGVVRKWEKKTEALPEQAKKVFTTTKVPALEELPPIASPFPVAGAKEKVEAEGSHKLPDQPMPALVKTPREFLPVVGAPPVDTRPPPVAPPAGLPAATSSTPVKAVNAAVASTPAVQPSDAGAVVSGTDRPPTVTIAPQHKETLAQVLANIYVEAQTRAVAVVKEAKEGAFPGKVLGTEFCFPEIGTPRIPEEKTWLEGELGRVADAAKISREVLDQKIEANRVALVDAGTAGVEAVSTTTTTVTKDVNQRAEATKSAIQSLRESWDNHFDAVAAQAKGGVDPKVVREEERKFSDQLRKYAIDHLVAFEGVARERNRKLDVARDAQLEAYAQAALADECDQAQASYAELQTDEMKEWLKARRKDVHIQVEKLKGDTTTLVDGWKTGMRTARDEAVDMVRAWADARIGRERGWLDALLARVFDAVATKHEETEAFEAMETEATVGELAQDLAMLETLKTDGYQALDADQKSRLQRTDEAGAALTSSFFGEGKKGDSVAALTASLGARLSKRRVAAVRKAFVDEVMGTTDFARWRDIDVLARAEVPGFSAAEKADELHKAFEYTWGTDEDRAYGAVAGLTALGGKAVRMAYRARWKEDLDARIADEMSSEEKDRVLFGLDAKAAEASAAALRDACEGAGTDEALINRVLRGKSEKERAEIRAAYRQLYGEDLDSRLNSELDDGFSDVDEWRITEAHLDGKPDKADAIEIKMARNAFWGPDRDKIESVYTRMHQEVTAEGDQKGWTSEEIDRQIAARSGKIQTEYKTETKKDLKTDLEAAFAPPPSQYPPGSYGAQYQAGYYGARRDLVIGMVEGDMTKVDAAKIQIERTSTYAEDDAINKTLASQYDRAYERERRDAIVQWRRDHDGRGPTDAEMKQLDTSIVERAKVRSQQSMLALGTRFTSSYGGEFREVITDLTQGWGETKALTLIDQGGHLENWQKFEFATRGAGTDEDALKALFKGKSKAEIKAMEDEWKSHTTSGLGSFSEVIEDETSGRLKQDLLLDNEFGGSPDNPDDAIAKSRRKLEYEARTGGTSVDQFGRTSKTDEYKVIEEDLAHLENIRTAYQAAVDSKDPIRMNAANLAWQSGVASLDSAVETNRHMVDQRTEVVAQVVSIVVMVVVMVVLTAVAEFFTAGAATPAVAAMWTAAIGGISALAGGLAAMAVKASIKGDAYGADEWGADLALALVDAVVSAATAGVGGKILRSAKGAAAVAKTGGKLTGRAAVLAPLGRMAEGGVGSRMTAHFIAEGAEGFVQSLPTAVLGTALNENTWKGNPLLNMLQGAGMGVGMGTLLSGGLGALGGTKVIRPVDAAPSHVSTGTHTSLVDATGADLAAMEAKYLADNPSLTRADFRKDFDALLMKQAEFDPVVRQKLEAQLRDEITDLLPPHQRGAFADTAVEMWDPKRFEAFTGSRTGDAVVIVKDGKPVVVVKQGAHPHALAEEGFHLAQSLQSKNAARFADLDEAKLAGWSRMDVREKIPIYRSKLELEIEAQQAMIDALSDRVAAGGRLSERLAVAEQTLLRLKERARQLDRLGPLQRTLMAWGVLPEPHWLNEPARLFAKTPKLDKSHLTAAALLDRARANGLDDTAARQHLASIYTSATRGGKGNRFPQLLAELATMEPKAALAFLEAAGPVLGGKGTKAQIGAVLEKAAKSADPPSAARLATLAPLSTADRILDRAARTRTGVPKDILNAAEELAGSIGRGTGRNKPWDQLTKVFDTDAVEAVRLAGIVKQAGLADAQVAEVVGRAGGLSKPRLAEFNFAAEYLGKVADNPAQHAQMVEAMTRGTGKDFVGFADAVHNLKKNDQIAPDAFDLLLRRGADGKVDLAWLGKLVGDGPNGRLHGWVVDELIRDPNTPWTKLQRRVGQMRGFYGSGVGTVRGIVGELFAKHLIPDHPGLGKNLLELLTQVTDGAGGKRPDIVALYRNGDFRAIEVKTWSKEFWSSTLQAYELAAIHGLEKAKAMRPELDFGAVEHMIAQLRNGGTNLQVPGGGKRLEPALMVTSDWKVAQGFDGLAAEGMARLQKELDGLGVTVHMMNQQHVDDLSKDLVRQFSTKAPIDRSIPLPTRSSSFTPFTKRPPAPPPGPQLIQPLGRGSTADPAKGRHLPRDLREHLAVQEAMQNPSVGVQAAGPLGDSRWPAADGWVKHQQTIDPGGRGGPISVHYNYNTLTKEVDDFKIVDRKPYLPPPEPNVPPHG